MSNLTTHRAEILEQYRTPGNLEARIALHARFSVNPYGFSRWVFDQMELREGMRVLEIGCGTGMLWRSNLDRIPASCHIELTDLSPGMIARAQSELPAGDPRFHFSVMDAETVDGPAAVYDLVVANHMLYHVERRELTFAGVARALKPGGVFCATTNGPAHIREIRDLAAEFGLTGWHRNVDRAFGLQNGGEQLAPWFPRIEMLRYDDELRVTDAQAVVDFILSAHNAQEILDEEKRRAMRGRVEERIEKEGVFRVTKEQGMFRATVRSSRFSGSFEGKTS
jgi:ubiquinone/menaquinone biosynthesis C-methylase UbiE